VFKIAKPNVNVSDEFTVDLRLLKFAGVTIFSGCLF